MHITLVITESVREENCEIYWYLGYVRRAQPKYNESWAARNAQVTNKYPYFVEIKWAYRVHSRRI